MVQVKSGHASRPDKRLGARLMNPYAGLLPGDRPDQITLEVSQVKVKTRIEERTELEITK